MFRIVFSNWFKLLKKVDTVIIFDGEKANNIRNIVFLCKEIFTVIHVYSYDL